MKNQLSFSVLPTEENYTVITGLTYKPYNTKIKKAMKEFMFYIRNEKDAKKSLSEDQHLAFIIQCEAYIGILKSENKLIAAQPIVQEGVVLKKTDNGGWAEKDIAADKETQVGYYHILANDLEEAIKIVKENPEFVSVPSATIEVRPVKTKEIETGLVYPTQ